MRQLPRAFRHRDATCSPTPACRSWSIRAWCAAWTTTRAPPSRSISTAVGAQNAVVAGGRYDGLVEALGGAAVAGTGFAIGVERIALALDAARFARGAPTLALIALGEPAMRRAMALASRDARAGLRVELLSPGARPQGAAAARRPARRALRGDYRRQRIRARGVVQLRDLKASTQSEVAQADLIGRRCHAAARRRELFRPRPAQVFFQRRNSYGRYTASIFTAAALAANRLLRHPARRRRRPRSRAVGMGRRAARPWRPDLYRSARPRRHRPAGLQSRATPPTRTRSPARARSEYYLAVRGKVVLRSEGTVNAELPTGEIEIAVTEAQILNPRAPPPFPLDAEATAEERAAALSLSRSAPPRDAAQSAPAPSGACAATRTFLDDNGFVEIETPILWRATPEGARDYLVPSRVNPGKFYALPQSPQLLKQLLMVGRFRPLLPDRALLSRRGSARQPPARVQPDRYRDDRSAPRRHHRDGRGHDGVDLPPRARSRARAAVSAPAVRRGDGTLRQSTSPTCASASN